MIRLIQSIKNLWGGWTNFAPKLLLALIGFSLLIFVFQVTGPLAGTFANSDSCKSRVSFEMEQRQGGAVGEAKLAGVAVNNCDKDVVLYLQEYWCKEVAQTCGNNKNERTITIAAGKREHFTVSQEVGGDGNGKCGSAQVDAMFTSNYDPNSGWPMEGVAAWSDKSCETVTPKVTCDSLVLEKVAGGQFRVKATVSGHGSDGGKIAKYRYDFGDGSGTQETVAPDSTKNHDYAGPGTYTVKGYVVGENGQVDGGARAGCEKNITFTQNNKSVVCDSVAITRLAGREVRLTVNGHGVNGGVISKYRFSFGQGPVVDRSAPDNTEDYTYTADGTYHLTGWVIDDQGSVVSSGACQGDITITTTTPRVVCDNVSLLKIGGRSVRFTVNGHGENGGVISKYRFNFGQGPVVDRNAPDNVEEYTYTADGNYVLTGSVIDASGNVVSGGACQTSVEFRTQPNFYCDVNNYRCIQCVPGTAGYDACKNKPSCTNDAQCTPQTNYYCDNNYACVSCVPGSANYNDCKNKPTCSTQDDCKVNSNFYCNDSKACVECKPGTAGYDACKNKPTCATDDSCKTQEQSYYACNDNNACQKFIGSGTSTCNPGSDDCSYHNECVGTTCARIKGAYRGGAFCSTDSMCQPVVNQSTYCDWLFVDPQTGNVGLTVNAQIAGHTINGGSISQYRFNFGDGTGDTVQSGDKLSHTFGQTGTYVISGAVIDNRGIQAGGSGACQKVVQVVPSGVTPPPPTGKGGVPATGAETVLLPLFSLLGTFGWAIRRVRGN